MTAGVLRVTERAKQRIHADRAEIEFKVTGGSFVLGQIAIDRCAEIKQLVEAIKRLGLKDEHIDVRSVSMKQSKGRIMSSSSAEYKLVVRVDDLDQIADVMSVLQSGDHVEIERVRWDYDNKQAIIRELCAQATRAAMQKAEVIAEAAGQRVTGIRVAADSQEPEFARLGSLAESDYAMMTEARSDARSFGAYPRKSRSLHIGTTYSASQEIARTVMLEVFLEPVAPVNSIVETPAEAKQ